MDVPQEPVRYKSHLLFGAENDSVSASLPPFSSDKRKMCRRQGETNVNNNQTASTSTDELKPQASPTLQKAVYSPQGMWNEKKANNAYIIQQQ
ncbi:hypothetical protein [Psychromonas arctica]|uniref:hypothetical protein n=1 Tax=Psychromonas arctica TaxID=168275 RepID=UPI0003FDD3E7|nr:hypothetical protein [Psychromonas arctica]